MFGILFFLLRCIGILTATLGLIALVNDIYKAFESGSFNPVPLGFQLFQLIPDQLNLAQAIIQRYIGAWLWDPVIQWLLLQPTFASLLMIGLAFYLVGRIVGR